jgi:hypothetical protein
MKIKYSYDPPHPLMRKILSLVSAKFWLIPSNYILPIPDYDLERDTHSNSCNLTVCKWIRNKPLHFHNKVGKGGATSCIKFKQRLVHIHLPQLHLPWIGRLSLQFCRCPDILEEKEGSIHVIAQYRHCIQFFIDYL